MILHYTYKIIEHLLIIMLNLSFFVLFLWLYSQFYTERLLLDLCVSLEVLLFSLNKSRKTILTCI